MAKYRVWGRYSKRSVVADSLLAAIEGSSMTRHLGIGVCLPVDIKQDGAWIEIDKEQVEQAQLEADQMAKDLAQETLDRWELEDRKRTAEENAQAETKGDK